MENKHWSQVQEAGAFWGLRFMFFVYRWLGRWAFTLLLYPVVLYFFSMHGAARRASYDYLGRVRGRGGIPAQGSIQLWSFRHFLQFGRGLLDKLAAWSGGFNYVNTQFHQADAFLEVVERGGGALLIVSHLGNLEVCRALANESRRVALNILVHTRHAEKFNRLMRSVDEKNQFNLIQVTEVSPATAMMLREKLDAGEVVVIAGDRTPVSGGRQCLANFLGQPAAFPQGPYILASVLRCPVFMMLCAQDNDGYHVFFEHITDRLRLGRSSREKDAAFWAQKYASILESYVLRFPLQWNNFYDFWAPLGAQASNQISE